MRPPSAVRVSRLLLAGSLLAAVPAAAAIPVAVSVEPYAWLVRSVGGDRVEVQVLVGSGATPETYQPSDADVSRVMRSRVYFRTGAPFERAPWFRALAGAGRIEVVDLLAGVDLLEMEGHTHAGHDEEPHEHGAADPHVWTSPRRLAIQARTVAAALVKADPSGRLAYEAGLRRTLVSLDRVDAELRGRLGPHAGRAFFVFHPAWGYFAADYGLRQVAVEVEGKEPTDRELTRLVARGREERVRVVFVQPQNRGAGAQAVADAVGAELVVADPLAPDLPANLRRVANRIAESFE